jgi:hypothetical protein
LRIIKTYQDIEILRQAGVLEVHPVAAAVLDKRDSWRGPIAELLERLDLVALRRQELAEGRPCTQHETERSQVQLGEKGDSLWHQTPRVCKSCDI